MSKSTQTHSPLPWKCSHFFNGANQRESWSIWYGDAEKSGYIVHSNISSFDTDEQNKANAELIVRAVNNHERLVKALTTLMDSWEDADGDFMDHFRASRELLQEVNNV